MTSRRAVYFSLCSCRMRYFFPSPSARMTMSLTSSARSNHVREAALHAAEVPHAQHEEREGYAHGNRQDLRVERGASAKEGPPKAIDDAHQGIQRVQGAPTLRHVGGGEGDRRDEQPELDDKRHDVAKVAIFDVER